MTDYNCWVIMYLVGSKFCIFLCARFIHRRVNMTVDKSVHVYLYKDAHDTYMTEITLTSCKSNFSDSRPGVSFQRRSSQS